MNKIFISALLFALVSAPAFAADDGFYAGISLGRSNNDIPPSPGVVTTNSSDTVLGILGGYQFTENWGIEAFYTPTGKWTAVDLSGKVASGNAKVFGIEAVGTQPLTNAFSLYGKLGFANNEVSANVAGNTGMSASRNAVTYGLGGIYDVNTRVGIRIGWDCFAATIDDVNGNGHNFNSNVYSLGAVFKF